MMKKTLLATTALISVAWAGSTLAQESMVMAPQGTDASLGGYYEFGFNSYSDERPTGASFIDEQRTYGDSELFVSFGRASDNGLEYGMDVQMELVHGGASVPNPAGGGDDIDEASMYIQGAFGRFVIGNNDHASDSFLTWIGADGSYGQDDAQRLPKGISDSAGTDGVLFDKDDNVLTDSVVLVKPFAVNPHYNDNSKIAYFSPNMSGLEFGASWEDSGDEDAGVSYGVSYEVPGTVLWGDLTLRAATLDSTDRDIATGLATRQLETVSYGLEHDFLDDFKIILGYAQIDDTNGGVDQKIRTMGAGIRYVVSDRLYVAYYQAESEEKVTGQEGTFASVSARYVLSPGLTASLSYNTFEIEQKGTGGVASHNGDTVYSNEGEEIVAQLEVGF